MDITEASAMTEASGLTSGQERIKHASEAIREMTEEMRGNAAPLASGPRSDAKHLSERLRQITLEAPLQSLLIAFLLGVLVARRG